MSFVVHAAGAGVAFAGDESRPYASYFRGAIVPMFTPYQDDDVEKVDLRALWQLTHWLCAQRVSALFPVSGMGQWQLLRVGEKREIVRTVVAAAAGCKPVVAGVGGTSEQETLALARDAIEAGADALAVVTPPFLRRDGALSQETLLGYYSRVANQLPPEVPILVYDVRGEVAPETMQALTRHRNVQAIKYRTDSSKAMARMTRRVGDRVAVLSGIELNTLATLAVGGVGVIGGGLNAYPNSIALIIERFEAGDMKGALAAQRRVIDFDEALESSLYMKLLLNRLASVEIAPNNRVGGPDRLEERRSVPAAGELERLLRIFDPVIDPVPAPGDPGP